MSEYRKNIKVALFLAFKNIVFNRKSLVLIATIIGLTYLSGIFIGGVIKGLQVLIEERMIDTLTGHVIILPEENEEYIYGVSSILKKVRSVSGVIEASPRFKIPATIVDKNGEKATIHLVVIDPEKETIVGGVDESIIDGRYLSPGTADGIVVGAVITKKYGIFESLRQIDIEVGDKVKVYTPLGEKRIKILGIYEAGVASAELYGYINKEQFEKIFGVDLGRKDVASEIIIRIKDKRKDDEVVKILKLLGIRADIKTWEEQLGTLSQFTDSLMIMNRIALAVSIIVAFGVIYIMMYINALQKRSQLGILKAIGIKSKVIIVSYVLQSLFYGCIGVLAGVFLSKLAVTYFTYSPIEMPFGFVVPVLQYDVMARSALFIIFSSIFAGYFASRGIVRSPILEMIFKG